jgi:hypothetical protein
MNESGFKFEIIDHISESPNLGYPMDRPNKQRMKCEKKIFDYFS